MKKIILLGRSCSGKGRLLENLLGLGMEFEVISTGGIFRSEMEQKTPLGIEVEPYLNKGRQVPDDLTNEIVIDRLKHEHGIPQFLDGFPRSIKQAKALIAVPADYYVVHVDTPEKICRARYISRNRHDDHWEAFEKKMVEYTEKVLPALKMLRGMFGVVEVDGRHTDHQYAKVVKYCSLDRHICPSRADKRIFDDFQLWAKHLGHEFPARAF